MTKRVVMSILGIGVAALVVSAGTLAMFSDKTANEDNVFASGTVDIKGTPHATLDIQNMVPSNTAQTSTWNLVYEGTLPAHVGLRAVASGDLITCDATNGLDIDISQGSTVITPGATLATAQWFEIKHGAAAGDTLPVTISYKLPFDAPNACQAKTAQLDLYAAAIQLDNVADPAPFGSAEDYDGD